MGSLTLVLRSAILASSALQAVGQSLGTGISSPSATGPYNNFTSHSTDLQTSTSSDGISSTPVTLSNDPTTITSSHSQPISNTSTTVDTAPPESSFSGEIGTAVTLSSSSSVLSGSSSSSSSTSLASETASNTTDVQISSTSSSISSSGTSRPFTSSTSNSESGSATSSGSSTATITATGSEFTATITSAPSTTITPSGSQASSSETALHTQLSSVIPIIQSWIDDDTEDIDPIISSLDDIEDETNDLLSEISDDSDKDTDHGCTANLFSLLTCVVDDVVSIKGSIAEGVVEGVTGLLEDLTDLTDELEDREDDDDDDDDDDSSTTSSQASTESSITSSTTSSSTSSCSSGTSVTEDYFVTCSPTVISSTTTQTCKTSTSTVSGCSVSATASTTTISSSAHPQCAQTGCSACTEITLPKPTAPCVDCITTVSGRAYPAEQTTVPSGADEITNLDELANTTTSSKRKRTLTTPADFNGNYLDFFTAQLQDPSLVNVPHRPAGTGGSSSALVQLYLDYPFSMTVQGLYGCTAVVLVSRRGVYMSHLFENPGFTSNFQNDIAQAIPNGDATPISIGSVFDGQPWCPDLRSLSAAGGTFDPNQEGGVKTILVTPGPYISDTTTNVYRYPNEINVIRTWLSNTFGSEPSDHIYTSTDNFMSNNQGVSFGKVLFQYDPNQAIAFEDKILNDGKTYRCPVKYAGVKLWSGFQQDFLGNDMDPFYEMDWPTQVYDPAGSVPGYQPDGQQKRDEVPEACTLVEDADSSTSSSASSTETSTSAGETSSGASSSRSPAPATSTPTSSSSASSIASSTSSSALSTVPYSAPLTLSTIASPTTSSLIATTSIGTYECKFINRDTAPELGCGIDPFWQCLGASTTLYLPGSATPSGSTIDADQTMQEPTYTGTVTGAGGCSSTAVSASKTETETRTSSEVSRPTFTGTCDTDTSRDLYGQCGWDDGSGIWQVGGCPSFDVFFFDDDDDDDDGDDDEFSVE
ncbi:hypothetical protein KC317_g6282 [Hortaea werneckii]|nr:hypothetical protein KC352_g12665 [Hortaea werneckii]KAI7565565.1 hypothetical protein KC317_g6282 [Hortaea werneckii]